MQTKRNNEGRYSAQPYYTEFRLGFLLGHETLTQLVDETNVPTIEAAREPEWSEPDHDMITKAEAVRCLLERGVRTTDV